MGQTRGESRLPLPLHPIFISALIVLIVNDQFLKQTFGNWWTGKISDAAWLVLCPLFIVGLYEHLAKRNSSMGIYVVSSVVVACALVAINTLPVAGDFYQTGLAAAQWPFKAVAVLFTGDEIPTVGAVALTGDSTDLITLPFALIAVAVGKSRQKDGPIARRWITSWRGVVSSRKNPAEA